MTTFTARDEELQRHFNAFHEARASTALVSRLYAQAMGDAYPAEVAASSSCDWNLLGHLVARLRLRPGQMLADVGCGTGGAGLWLARALSSDLVGIDVSSTAVELATARRSDFVPTGGAHFRIGTLEATGLPDQHADAALCIDALCNATQAQAALVELHRILRPGARAVITRAVRTDADDRWTQEFSEAGFDIEDIHERPEEPAMWRRLYKLWITHEGALRRELGYTQAENMLAEALRVRPRLDMRRAVAVTLRRPAR
ncbi:class I SAM-dependent methyltransferase [Streptomyces sp. 12297]